MPRKPVETCKVANQHCRSPANLSPPVSARATCVSCGEAVCTAAGCSLIMFNYLGYGRGRVCYDCLGERRTDHPILERAWGAYPQ